MSDDDIKWESAFSDDSLDDVAEAAADAADETTEVDQTPEEAQVEPPPVEPPQVEPDAVPPIAEMTAPPVIEQPMEPQPAAPPTPAPAPAPEPAAAAAPPRQPAPTQEMPVVAPPPIDDDDDDTGGGIPIKTIAGALAVVVPLAIAAFMYFSGGGDPKEALCGGAADAADGVQDGLGDVVSSNCEDDGAGEPATESTGPVGGETASSTDAAEETGTTVEVVDTEVTDEPDTTDLPDPPPTNPPLSFVYPAGINDVAPDGALASGCTPNSDNAPDGIWFVLLSSWSSEAITVDFSCAYTGANADDQAVLRGENVEQPKIYLTNDNQKLRTASFATDARLIVPPQVAAEFGYDEVYGTDVLDPVLGVLDSDFAGTVPMFIFVNNGVVTEMVVQNPDAVQVAGPLLPTVTSNCPPAQEPPTPVVEVAGIPANDPDGGLNIRATPVDGTIFFAAPNGTQLTITGGCELINGLAWWQIQTPDTTGWASSKYLVPSSS